MAFSLGWSFKRFPFNSARPNSSVPLQMGSLLADGRGHPASFSSPGEGMDLEFDAVLLDTSEFFEQPTSQLQARGPASGSGDVLEWLEAAVFGEDEDFGALLVEPLTARVALGPIYDDIFGNAADVSKASKWPGAGEGVSEQPARSEARVSAAAASGQEAESDPLGKLGSNVGSESASRGCEEYNALETVVSILQNVFQEESIGAEELDRTISGAGDRGDDGGSSKVPSSWAAVAGNVTSSAASSNPRTARKAALAKHKAGVAGLNLLLADAPLRKGSGQQRPGRQGNAVDAGSASAEWGPLKEERNPRMRAGKWKTHGCQRYKQGGNFGKASKAGYRGAWRGSLQGRLYRKADAWQECMAEDFIAE